MGGGPDWKGALRRGGSGSSFSIFSCSCESCSIVPHVSSSLGSVVCPGGGVCGVVVGVAGGGFLLLLVFVEDGLVPLNA